MSLIPSRRTGKQGKEDFFPYLNSLKDRFPLIHEHNLLDIYRSYKYNTPFQTQVLTVERACEVADYLLSRDIPALKKFDKAWVTTKAFQFGILSVQEVRFCITQYESSDKPFILKAETLLVLREILRWMEEKLRPSP